MKDKRTFSVAFTKRYINNNYELLYNGETGFEILRGINGKNDPFSLELPSLLDIGIMGTCKNKCPMCYQGHVDKPNMKLEDFKSIIDQVKDHTNQVALGGRGDPNKHEHFKEIVEYCRKNNVIPNYTTSGIKLTDDEVEVSKLCGVVAVSDYEQSYTYNALNNFIEAGVKTNIHQIFSKATFHKCISILYGYDDSYSYYGEHSKRHQYFDISKLNAVIFLLFKPQGAGKYLYDIKPTPFHFKYIADLMLNPKCKYKVGMDSCMVNHMLNYGEPTELQKICMDTCEGARMSAYITPDMKMKPCSFGSNDWGVDISKNSIKDVWDNSKEFKSFRHTLMVKSNQCPYKL